MARVMATGAAAALLLAGLAGCGGAGPDGKAADGKAAAGTGVDGTGVDGKIVMCHFSEVPLWALREGRPATELGPVGRAALKGTEVRRIDDLDTWTVVEESHTRLALIRELARPQVQGDGMVFTHEFLDVERFGDPDADGRPGWHSRASGRCDLRRDLGELGVADVTLDPAAPPPGPDSRRISVLVHERDCASGQRADGRIRLLGVEPTAAEVRVVLGVRRVDGYVTCQPNPATPFTVELDEPLGERVLTDASVYPPRPISLPVTAGRP
ncbi:hypothetical protein [Microtetraspora fusca]|uniref:hypothetical protein n=1 Tax=Microtetraspora fusca TaxID=1997 RepID=UPI000833E4DF|nr:hypothetical protein [Microtetraspora fusca]